MRQLGSVILPNGKPIQHGIRGSAWHPRYIQQKEKDYVSGAALLIRKKLFHIVGGFDPRYAPAYYEDVDLCLSLKQRGFKIIYYPSSTVSHINNATSADPTYGFNLPALGEINRQIE